jgi:hypothetical protein
MENEDPDETAGWGCFQCRTTTRMAGKANCRSTFQSLSTLGHSANRSRRHAGAEPPISHQLQHKRECYAHSFSSLSAADRRSRSPYKIDFVCGSPCPFYRHQQSLHSKSIFDE